MAAMAMMTASAVINLTRESVSSAFLNSYRLHSGPGQEPIACNPWAKLI
jgi:hypothetical protein